MGSFLVAEFLVANKRITAEGEL